MRRSTDWFLKAGWGVMFHYLDGKASGTDESTTTTEEWNKRVDGFDVERFANQVQETGARYVIFTLGQNSGHYCSPNATYDAIVGHNPSRCSKRDLIADVAKALTARKIRLVAYAPSSAPSNDSVAMKRLQWHQTFDVTDKPPERLREFQIHWEAILREWSLRWGSLVSGWWIDGCYAPKAMYEHEDAPNFASFSAALRAGNANSIVAYNPGVKVPIISMTEHEDYTAGEISGALPLGTLRPDCDWKPVPFDTFVGTARLHALSYLGEWWGQGTPRMPDELVIGFTRLLNSQGGVVTWDVPISDTGKIPDLFIQQLQKLF